jgi:hypothetical protein
MTTVTLSKSELMCAAVTGATRQINAFEKGYKDQHGFNPGRGWHQHIEGACGEIAAAKVIDRYWGAPCGTFRSGGDIGKNIQVRTRSKPEWDLIVRKTDDPQHFFILVTGTAPTLTVVGWIRGADAQKDEYWKKYGEGEEAWFVPQRALTAL